MFAAKDTLLTRPSGYQISRSVRLRSSASAYLNRTPATASNRKTFTFSAWIKLGTLGSEEAVFTGYTDANNRWYVRFESNTFRIFWNVAGTSNELITSAIFRDPSAWYHFVVVVDTTQATNTNRIKVYVNGIEQTLTGTYIPQNTDTQWNNNVVQQIGRKDTGGGFFDGYLTEINSVDGAALTPSSFGETNAITGVWQPKKYGGTYGTNGFYLNFSDNSASTAAAIGKDYSGNGNNWTPNNISVTAGVTYDSMVDVPTLYADGGNGRGNYCVLNPLASPGTITNGNLDVSTTSPNATSATFFQSTGKWYWEVISTSGTAANTRFGVINTSGISADLGGSANGWAYLGDARVYNNGSTTLYGVTYTTNDVLMIALDLDAGKIWYGKNGTWMASGVPSTGTSPSQTFTANQLMSPAVASGTGTIVYSLNCGQRPFSYTPPTGFVALNTQNLPAPTISNGASYMAATTYTGTGASLTIANTVGSASFQPDLVWVKGRSGATDHAWYDAVRGVQKQLESNNTAAETTETTGLTAFGSTGFTVGALAQMNTNAATYVGWQWNAGGSTVTNTTGSISAQVRANATAGFSVVTYTGTGANATVGHGLGVTPSMVIVKARSTTGNWCVTMPTLGANNVPFLDLTNAAASFPTVFNGLPTSTIFNIGTAGSTNTNAATFVAYCFAAVAGYSAFGSYTGNGSTDGPFVHTGFRPRFVMIKRSDSADDWVMMDSSRSTYNVAILTLYANGSFAEDSNVTNRAEDFLSNGFKLRSSATFLNASGGTYIYMAFAENPFKLSLAR